MFGLIARPDKSDAILRPVTVSKLVSVGLLGSNCDAFSNNNDNVFSVYFTNKSRTGAPHALHPRPGSSWGAVIIAVGRYLDLHRTPVLVL